MLFYINAILHLQVLTHRHIDHDLGLGYLCSLPSKNGIETMTALKGKFGSKYRRMEVADNSCTSLLH